VVDVEVDGIGLTRPLNDPCGQPLTPVMKNPDGTRSTRCNQNNRITLARPSIPSHPLSSPITPLIASAMPRGKLWAVSHIVAEDDSNPNKRLFLVHWQGYSAAYDTWEPLKNLLPGSKDIVREWDKEKKLKVKEEKAAVKQERREYLAERREKKILKRSASQISLDERKAGAGGVKLNQTV
jgi:hypothetical protein